MGGNLMQTMKFRDLQVAEDVQKKAQLGWLDMEFTVYGTAYCQNEEMYYKISADAGKIYTFIEQAAYENIYCSDMMTYTKKCAVPLGMKDEILQKVKMELACQLRRQYPQEMFALLDDLAGRVRSDSAYEWLLTQREQLEGVFDECRLRFFSDQIKHCYGALKLSAEHYRQLLAWVREEEACMQDLCVCKDIFEKTFYGIAYYEEGQWQYADDCVRENIYQQKFDLERAGILTTPVFGQTLWYNYTFTLRQCRQAYLMTLERLMNQDYLAALSAIFTTAAPVDYPAAIVQSMTKAAQQTLRRYFNKWGIRAV